MGVPVAEAATRNPYNSGDVGHHLGRQALHLLGFVEEWGQQDSWAPASATSRRPDARLRRTGDGDRLEAAGHTAAPMHRLSGAWHARRRRRRRCRPAWRSGSRPRLAPSRPTLPARRRPARRIGGCRRPGTEEAIAALHGAPQCRRSIAAEPKWRVGLLEGLGFHGRVLELPEAPGERDLRLGPERLHQLQSLGEPGHQGARVDPEGEKARPPAPVPTPTSMRPRPIWSSEPMLRPGGPGYAAT